MTQGKRKKDAAIAEIRAALEQLLDELDKYHVQLQTELEEERQKQEPYDHLLRALERQIASIEKMEATLDETAWEQLIRLANGSAYVEHARTRDYF